MGKWKEIKGQPKRAITKPVIAPAPQAKAYPTGPAKQDPEERKKLSTPIKQSEPKPTVKHPTGAKFLSKEENDRLWAQYRKDKAAGKFKKIKVRR